jgi:hypothetical protein
VLGAVANRGEIEELCAGQKKGSKGGLIDAIEQKATKPKPHSPLCPSLCVWPVCPSSTAFKSFHLCWWWCWRPEHGHALRHSVRIIRERVMPTLTDKCFTQNRFNRGYRDRRFKKNPRSEFGDRIRSKSSARDVRVKHPRNRTDTPARQTARTRRLLDDNWRGAAEVRWSSYRAASETWFIQVPPAEGRHPSPRPVSISSGTTQVTEESRTGTWAY